MNFLPSINSNILFKGLCKTIIIMKLYLALYRLQSTSIYSHLSFTTNLEAKDSIMKEVPQTWKDRRVTTCPINVTV